MRDYLYLWHDPATKRLLASGIEFGDLIAELETGGGVLLLRHQFDGASLDHASRLDYLPTDELALLIEDKPYGYGDFCWADFARGDSPPTLTDQAVAELTFFAHAMRPLADVEIAGLQNRLLCWAHDDGWYARLFYVEWTLVESMLRRLLTRLLTDVDTDRVLNRLRDGSGAVWCRSGSVLECEASEDMDAVLRKHLQAS